MKAQKLIEDWDLNFDDLISEKSRLRFRKQSVRSLKSATSIKSRVSIK